MNHTAADNIDAGEIAKFDRLAHRWWDLDGEFKPLHAMNPVRASYLDCRVTLAGKRLLDIGCGGGIFSEAMAQRGALVTGIDMGQNALQVAQLHALESGLTIDYQVRSAEQFAQEQPGQFEVLSCLEMLEHVPDPSSVIRACAQLLAPGGQAFFSTLNRTPKAYGIAILGAEYLLGWLPKGTHHYRAFIRPSELARSCREAGLVVKDICGIRYNPVTQTFALNPQDTAVNYLLHCEKPHQQ
jgi:2-polyprenyl-6-hydroxyphenyl methylase / 3-demethylubiquinone-9 3-methyltransferase